jgi:tetratricopeptide (TPR) repeat protein
MSAKTVFLSHRRKDFGKHFARSVQLALKVQGFDVFLDVETIEAGKWETQILAGIDQRSHFLLLLTPGCFDGCDSPDDWVRREFERAVETRRNIVLIFEQDALYAELNASCPEPMRAAFDYQGHRIHDTSFEKDIEILREKHLHPSKAPSVSPTIPADEILHRLDAIAAQQRITTAHIRAHLLESTERQRDADLAVADKAPKSDERQRLRETALAAHTARLARIDDAVARFAELESGPEATRVGRELTRILTDEGTDAALAFIGREKAGLLAEADAQLAADRERLRGRLAPLLSAADLLVTKGDTAAARTACRELLQRDPAWPAALSAFAWFLFDQSIQNLAHRTVVAALADAEEAHILATRWHEAAPADAKARRLLSATHNQMGDVLIQRGQPGDAAQVEQHYTRCNELLEKLLADNPGSALAVRDVSISLERLGDFLAQRAQPGDAEQALGHYTRSLELREKLLADNPGSAQAVRDVSVSLYKLGDLLAKRAQPGDAEKALGHFTRSLELSEKLLTDNPGSTQAVRDVSISLERLGDFLAQRAQPGDADKTLGHHTRSLEVREKLLADNPGSAQAALDVAISHERLGDFAGDHGKPADAEAHYRHSLETWERMSKANPDNAYYARGGVVPLLRMAGLASKRGDKKDETLHRRAIHDLLKPRIERGMTFDPPTVKLYEVLKAEFAK